VTGFGATGEMKSAESAGFMRVLRIWRISLAVSIVTSKLPGCENHVKALLDKAFAEPCEILDMCPKDKKPRIRAWPWRAA
jgi:hypothetical protein